MASHSITFSLNDALYRQLMQRQESEGKHFTPDGIPVSVDVYAKELLTNLLSSEVKPKQ